MMKGKIMKNKIKKFLKLFSKKVPVNIPVLHGDLLTNRTALITGGNGGIGFEIAKNFVLNNCNVIITGRNEEQLKKCTEELNKLKKGKCKFYVFDISKTEQIETNLDNIIKENKIDILVNNAGVLFGNNIGNTSIKDFEDTIKINLEGTYFITQKIANYMVENKIKGNILNISSSSSVRPAINPYSISKWGMNGLTLGLAKKYIKYGIVVNGIAPGPTATKMLMKNSENGIDNDRSPVGRYIMPEEIANIATVLVSSMGRMIVGDTIYITGGAGLITFDDINY